MRSQSPTRSTVVPALPNARLVRGVVLSVIALCSWALLPVAQAASRITTWRSSDGLPQSAILTVTLSSRSHVLTTHAASLPIARFDGFNFTIYSNLVASANRVYESRSEQLWSVSPEGLLESTADVWNSHPVAEIAAELRTNPLRSIRPIPLVPLDRNRVLALLPDRLFEYDATDRSSRILRLAIDTRLARFNELNTSHDDGAWISGSRGILRIPGPLRHFRPDSPIEEYPLPDALNAAEIQRPFENILGQLVMAAEDRTSRERIILRFVEGQWNRWNLQGQNVRQAWSDSEGQLWAHTSGTVFRFDPVGDDLRPEPVLQVGRVADIALEPRGAAWIATSEGLTRIAPLPWKPVFPPGPTTVPIQTITSGSRGIVIAAGPTSVHWLTETQWRTTQLTNALPDEPAADPVLAAPLEDDSVLIHSSGSNWIVTPNLLATPAPPDIAGKRPVGSLPDGRILLADSSGNPSPLTAFDGRTGSDFVQLPDQTGPLAFALVMRTGELLVGGPAGLSLRRGDQWHRIDPDPSLSVLRGENDGARVALELPEGSILIGGDDALREFDGQSWRLLRRGLERVHDLHRSRDGTLWVASQNGLHRYRDRSWFAFGEDEGLPPGPVFTVYSDGAGNLWAGTSRGLYRFDPNADTDSPQAEITDIDVPTQAGEHRARFVVGGRDRCRFAPASRLMFSWRLDNGPWSVWRPATSDQFTNLAAGIHRLEVRSMDPSGNLLGAVASHEFSVTLPWFQDPRLVGASIGLALLIFALGAQAIHGYFRLKRSYDEVERQVAERSAALERANTELLHAQKMRALGTLAAGIAHDFNNLLSIIRGSAQLVESQLHDTEKSRQRLARIRTAVDQGAGLVRAMLGYSRDSSSARREVDLLETVLGSLRLMEERLPGRLEFNPSGFTSLRVLAQPEMLQQILLNLIQNADEASDFKGAIRVEVETADVPPPDSWLQPTPASRYAAVLIRDQGSGIPSEILPRIFEPFFTTKGFSSRRGTGLGLSMVYEFAKEMGAGITVETAVGKGTTFRIILPMVAPATRGADA